MLRSTLAALVLLTAPAPVGAETMTMDHVMPARRQAATPADKANAAAMAKMMKSMAVKPTGNPDRDFVLMMLPHHQGAVDMAQVELTYGADPELRTLAQAVVEAQTKEIAQMQAWLAKHGH